MDSYTALVALNVLHMLSTVLLTVFMVQVWKRPDQQYTHTLARLEMIEATNALLARQVKSACGRLDRSRRGESSPGPKYEHGDEDLEPEIDPQLAAMLEMQSAPPAPR